MKRQPQVKYTIEIKTADGYWKEAKHYKTKTWVTKAKRALTAQGVIARVINNDRY